MSALRHARILARLVLAWYLLAVGVAVAGPLTQPQGAQWMCTGGGGMTLVLPEEGGLAAPMLDCPLCSAPLADAPGPGAWNWRPVALAPQQPVPGWIAPSHAPASEPPPARGPPHGS